MASINYATREISCKIVYYGPGLSGKTTNLQIIHRKVPNKEKSEMVSLATETDRTLFFDFLPLDLGSIKGFSTKFQLYTVPGQVYYNATRKLVLRGVDGVVFVADSQADKLQENLESFANLEENLREYGHSLDTIPMVLQFNKRDLPNVMSVEELSSFLNKYQSPYFEAVASTGVGVFTTLKAIGKSVIDRFNAKYAGYQGGTRRPPAMRPGQSRPAPTSAPQSPPARPAPQAMPPQSGFPQQGGQSFPGQAGFGAPAQGGFAQNSGFPAPPKPASQQSPNPFLQGGHSGSPGGQQPASNPFAAPPPQPGSPFLNPGMGNRPPAPPGGFSGQNPNIPVAPFVEGFGNPGGSGGMPPRPAPGGPPGGFGSPPQTGGFGSAPQQDGFGSAPQQGGFGSQPQQGGFGSPPQQGGFGSPPQNPFGGSAPQRPYPPQAPQGSPFGSPGGQPPGPGPGGFPPKFPPAGPGGPALPTMDRQNNAGFNPSPFGSPQPGQGNPQNRQDNPNPFGPGGGQQGNYPPPEQQPRPSPFIQPPPRSDQSGIVSTYEDQRQGDFKTRRIPLPSEKKKGLFGGLFGKEK